MPCLELLAERIRAICTAEAAPLRRRARPAGERAVQRFLAVLQQAISAAAERHGYCAMPILSYAGHDSRHLAKRAPAAMIFIPCRDGISHAEAEWSEPAHVAAGAQVLCDVLADLLASF